MMREGRERERERERERVGGLLLNSRRELNAICIIGRVGSGNVCTRRRLLFGADRDYLAYLRVVAEKQSVPALVCLSFSYSSTRLFARLLAC
jgi:hypothetical protein